MIEAYKNALKDRLGAQAADADIHDVSAVRDVVIPEGQIDSRVRFLGGRLTGRVPASLEILVNGRKVKTVRVVGIVDLYGEVLVAVGNLNRNQVLDRSDVRLERINLTKVRGSTTQSVEDVEGLTLMNPVAAGEPIILARLKRKPLIKKGEVVTMICKGPGLIITTKGKALRTGYKDGPIRLENIKSGRKVYGKVLASGEVEVDF
jgi:flagella basal body P-ring formation protein FlgA